MRYSVYQIGEIVPKAFLKGLVCNKVLVFIRIITDSHLGAGCGSEISAYIHSDHEVNTEGNF
jgi:hypothetical protein